MLLCELLEEQAQDITLLMSLLELYMVLFCSGSCLFQGMDLVKVNAGIFLDGIHHSNSLERFAQIHLHAIVSDHSGSQNLLRHMAVQVLCQVHHSLVICVSLIQLHQRKFRVVSGIQALVAEYSSNLVYALHAANDQSLQIQFQGDTQLKVLIKSIEMCLERSCGCTTCICHQHRGLHLHKSLAVQVFTDAADDLGTFDESVLYFRVHDQVHISLTVTQVCVGQTVELLRQNLEALG